MRTIKIEDKFVNPWLRFVAGVVFCSHRVPCYRKRKKRLKYQVLNFSKIPNAVFVRTTQNITRNKFSKFRLRFVEVVFFGNNIFGKIASAPNDNQITLNAMCKGTSYVYNYCLRIPNFTPFRSTIALYGVVLTDLSKVFDYTHFSQYNLPNSYFNAAHGRSVHF